MNKKLYSSIAKFVISGGISTCINYGIFYWLLNKLHINYLSASIIGYSSGLSIGFILNNFWTFDAGNFRFLRLLAYSIIYLISLLISISFLWLTVSKLGFNPLYMNVLAIGLSTISNYIGLRFLVYNETI